MKKFIITISLIGLGFLGVLLFVYGLSINPQIHKETNFPVGSSLPICKVGNVQRIYYDGGWYRLPPDYADSSTFLIPLLNPPSMGLEKRRLGYAKSQDQFFENRVTSYTDKRKKTERTILLVLGACMLGASLVVSVILNFRKKPPKTL